MNETKRRSFHNNSRNTHPELKKKKWSKAKQEEKKAPSNDDGVGNSIKAALHALVPQWHLNLQKQRGQSVGRTRRKKGKQKI